jgi:chorismate synthase
MKNQDSSGGMIECVATGVPVGIGDPVFHKLDASLAKSVMSIGAVKGVEIGDGFAVCHATGSTNNDTFRAEDGIVRKETNHAGGILGGVSDGSPIILRAAIKPTPSISRAQNTITTAHENTQIEITGRHDPVIVPRAVVVVESMVAITLTDLLFTNMSAQMDRITEFYRS